MCGIGEDRLSSAATLNLHAATARSRAVLATAALLCSRVQLHRPFHFASPSPVVVVCSRNSSPACPRLLPCCSSLLLPFLLPSSSLPAFTAMASQEEFSSGGGTGELNVQSVDLSECKELNQPVPLQATLCRKGVYAILKDCPCKVTLTATAAEHGTAEPHRAAVALAPRRSADATTWRAVVAAIAIAAVRYRPSHDELCTDGWSFPLPLLSPLHFLLPCLCPPPFRVCVVIGGRSEDQQDGQARFVQGQHGGLRHHHQQEVPGDGARAHDDVRLHPRQGRVRGGGHHAGPDHRHDARRAGEVLQRPGGPRGRRQTRGRLPGERGQGRRPVLDHHRRVRAAHGGQEMVHSTAHERSALTSRDTTLTPRLCRRCSSARRCRRMANMLVESFKAGKGSE